MLPAIGLCNALRMSKLHGHRHLTQESRLECQSNLFRHGPPVFPDEIMVFEVIQQSLLSWLTVPLALLAYRS